MQLQTKIIINKNGIIKKISGFNKYLKRNLSRLNQTEVTEKKQFLLFWIMPIEMKRITRCKLAVLFESANRRKFLGQFGSKVASL